MSKAKLKSAFALAVFCCFAPLPPSEAGSPAPAAILAPASALHGMVATQEKQATEIGVDILRRGGNAVDAAVAVGFALAVTLPEAGNLGGGGFMLVHLAGQNKTIAIDYRETAPSDTPQTVFLDEHGNAVPAKSRDSGLGIGVPSTVAGLSYALDHYGSGKFSLADLIAPAIPLARDGIVVDDDLAASLAEAEKRLARWPSSAAIFLHKDGTPLKSRRETRAE